MSKITELFKILGIITLINFCFACLAVFGKQALLNVHPFVLLVFRTGSTTFIFAIVMTVMNKWHLFVELFKKDLRITFNVFLFGLLGLSLVQAFFLYGLRMTTSTNTQIICLVSIIFATIFCMILKFEERSWIKGLGILISIGGCIVLLEGKFDFHSDVTIGNLIILGDQFLYAIYLTFLKRSTKGIDPVVSAFTQFLSGASLNAIVIVPFYYKEFNITTYSTQTLIAVIIVILIGTAIPWLLLVVALTKSSPVLVSLGAVMNLIFTIIMSSIVLSEQLSIYSLIGMIVILFGLFTVTFMKYREGRDEKPYEQDEENSGENLPILKK